MKFKKNMSLLGVALVCSGTLATAGNVFAATASPTSQDTPVKATVTVDKITTIPLPTSSDSNDHTTNSNTNTNTNTPGFEAAKVAIAYQPIAFTGSGSISNGTTAASIPMKISTVDGQSTSSVGHVGVKDQTKTKNHWLLKATFTTDPSLTGLTLSLADGKVQLNNGGTLGALPNDEVTAETSPTLSTTPTTLLTATDQKVQYGIYDYQFDGVKLNIANPSQVAAGDYSGNVNWNLANTPT